MCLIILIMAFIFDYKVNKNLTIIINFANEVVHLCDFIVDTFEMAKNIPVNRIARISDNGVFVKHTDDWQKQTPLDFVHRDDYYMFAVLLDGNADAMVDFRNISLSGGEGIIVSPGQVHLPKIGAVIPTAWSLFIAADLIPDDLHEKIERYSLSTSPLRFSGTDLQDISSLFGILNRNVSNGVLARFLSLSIVALFCSAIPDVTDNTADRYVALTLRFKRLVDAIYVDEKHPAEYASRLNVSRVYLNEAVKATTGVSVGKYIRATVMVNAKRLLAHTTMNISEIAQSLGYDDASYFERMFRKESGMTPSEFRKNIV